MLINQVLKPVSAVEYRLVLISRTLSMSAMISFRKQIDPRQPKSLNPRCEPAYANY